MSDIGIPVATLRQMATEQLLHVVHAILTIIAEQVEANLPVGGEEAPGTWEDHFRETVFSIFFDPEN